jgi:NitT/TauT family transport system permease protein
VLYFGVFSIALLLSWELVVRGLGIRPLILPSPTAIGQAMVDNASTLAVETAVTAYEALAGFLIALAAGVVLAVVFVHSNPLRKAAYPYAIALKSTPLVAIAPLIVLWFGTGTASKVVMAALIAFFPVLVNSIKGMTAIEPEINDLARTLSAPWWRLLVQVRFPGSLPYLFQALRISSTLSVVGALIAEFTGANRGIGHIITQSTYYLDTPLTFAAVICITLAAVGFFYIIARLESYFVFWQTPIWA